MFFKEFAINSITQEQIEADRPLQQQLYDMMSAAMSDIHSQYTSGQLSQKEYDTALYKGLLIERCTVSEFWDEKVLSWRFRHFNSEEKILLLTTMHEYAF